MSSLYYFLLFHLFSTSHLPPVYFPSTSPPSTTLSTTLPLLPVYQKLPSWRCLSKPVFHGLRSAPLYQSFTKKHFTYRTTGEARSAKPGPLVKGYTLIASDSSINICTSINHSQVHLSRYPSFLSTYQRLGIGFRIIHLLKYHWAIEIRRPIPHLTIFIVTIPRSRCNYASDY